MPTIHVIQVKRGAYDIAVVNSKGSAFVHSQRHPARPLALKSARDLAAHIKTGAHATPAEWHKVPTLDNLTIIDTITE